jgi:hypothetical protein
VFQVGFSSDNWIFRWLFCRRESSEVRWLNFLPIMAHRVVHLRKQCADANSAIGIFVLVGTSGRDVAEQRVDWQRHENQDSSPQAMCKTQVDSSFLRTLKSACNISHLTSRCSSVRDE